MNAEVLQVTESIAREKDIPKDTLISIVEQTIQLISKKKYGSEHNIKVEVNRKNGQFKLYRVLDVVANEAVDSLTQISLRDAQHKSPNIQVGEQLLEPLPPINLDRVSAQTAKHFIIQRVREIERERQYLEFKDRVGEIINVVVSRIESGNVIVDLGGFEAIIPKDQLIKNEVYKKDDRIKAYVQQVNSEPKGPLAFLSRTDNQILVKLLEAEVPEIYDGTIVVKAVARDPGSKSKVAVFSSDTSIDPIGACLGIRGNRIKSITNELAGERIDVVKWSSNIAEFAVNTMTQVRVTKVIIDESKHLLEMIVAASQLSAAIGRRGQNVKLISQMIGWNVDIITEEQESARRTDEFTSVTNLFTQNLEVDEMIAQLLVVEGFTTIEQLAHVNPSTLADIDGFDIQLVEEIQRRAVEYIDNRNKSILIKLEQLGVEQEILEALDIPLELFVTLAENGIKSIEDLEDVSFGEFNTLAPGHQLSKEEYRNIIAISRRTKN